MTRQIRHQSLTLRSLGPSGEPPPLLHGSHAGVAGVDKRGGAGYLAGMDSATAIARLKAHEAELRAMGVAGLSLFGSVARGEAGPGSDVDVAARLDERRRLGLFELGGIVDALQEALGVQVDLVTEPVSKPRLGSEIERDRVHVF